MKRGKENKRKGKSGWSDKITKIRLDKEIGHICRNILNKRNGKHSGKCIKSGNNECRKCPKNAKNIRKNIPCDIMHLGQKVIHPDVLVEVFNVRSIVQHPNGNPEFPSKSADNSATLQSGKTLLLSG